MKRSFEITPYESVGPINFGMSRAELEKILGKPDSVDIDRTTDLRWSNLTARLNSKQTLYEMSFIKGPFKVYFNDQELLNERHLDKVLGKIEDPLERLGFKVYFSLGIAITGFSKVVDAKALTVFSKDQKRWWKKFVDEK